MTQDASVTLRHLAWYEGRNLTAEALKAFQAWQREKRLFPLAGTVTIEELPDGRRNYKGAFDVADSYRVVWWFEAQKIPVALVTASTDPT